MVPPNKLMKGVEQGKKRSKKAGERVRRVENSGLFFGKSNLAETDAALAGS